MKHDSRGTCLSNGSTTFPGLLIDSTSLLPPPPHEPDPRSFPSPGRMVSTLKWDMNTSAMKSHTVHKQEVKCV